METLFLQDFIKFADSSIKYVGKEMYFLRFPVRHFPTFNFLPTDKPYKKGHLSTGRQRALKLLLLRQIFMTFWLFRWPFFPFGGLNFAATRANRLRTGGVAGS